MAFPETQTSIQAMVALVVVVAVAVAVAAALPLLPSVTLGILAPSQRRPVRRATPARAHQMAPRRPRPRVIVEFSELCWVALRIIIVPLPVHRWILHLLRATRGLMQRPRPYRRPPRLIVGSLEIS